MTTLSTPSELAPKFEAVLMPHDGNIEALARLNSATLLPVDLARKVLVGSERLPYAPVTARDGKPYAQFRLDGALRRFYLFANPEVPNDPAQMLALQCTVTLDKSGVVVVMPERLLRGTDADAVLSVKYGCCSGGRTMIYTDRRTGGTAFIRTSSSGADVQPEIRRLWQSLVLVSLDAGGMAALAHLADDLRGTCGGHAHGHAARPDYGRGASWAGTRLAVT